MEDKKPKNKSCRRGFLKAGLEAIKLGVAYKAYEMLDPSVEHLLEAYQSGRRLVRTLTHMGFGNEGQQELSRLEQELEQAEQTLDRQSLQYQQLFEKKRGVLEQLQSVYDQNETIKRQAIRVAKNIEITLGDIGEAGEALKEDTLWQQLDDGVIDFVDALAEAAGTDFYTAEEARERHEIVKQYHQALREAYTNDENMQQTIADFLIYLNETKNEAKKLNRDIDQHFPNLTRLLRENYDQMHRLEDEGTQVTNEMRPEIAGLRERIEDIHDDLQDDGVTMRTLQTGEEITGYKYLDQVLANDYARKGAGTLAGALLLTGAIAYVTAPFKPAYAVGKAGANAAKKALGWFSKRKAKVEEQYQRKNK